MPVLHNVFTSEVRLVSAKTHACHPGKVETHLAGMSVVEAKREREKGEGGERGGEGERETREVFSISTRHKHLSIWHCGNL